MCPTPYALCLAQRAVCCVPGSDFTTIGPDVLFFLLSQTFVRRLARRWQFGNQGTLHSGGSNRAPGGAVYWELHSSTLQYKWFVDVADVDPRAHQENPKCL
jgi:hypothetical protein